MGEMNDAGPPANCDWLDDYLDGALNQPQQQQFSHHLAICAHCREAAELQGKIDRLIRQGTSVDPPATLRLAFERRVQYRARQRRLVGAGLLMAAAASILAIFNFSRLEDPPTPEADTLSTRQSVQSIQVDPVPPTAVSYTSPPAVEVSVEAGDDLLAVRQPSKHANVTVFLLFPIVRPAAEPAAGGNEPLESILEENAL